MCKSNSAAPVVDANYFERPFARKLPNGGRYICKRLVACGSGIFQKQGFSLSKTEAKKEQYTRLPTSPLAA